MTDLPLNENDVVNLLADHLTATGWTVERAARTTQTGDDVVAHSEGPDSVTIAVEAKGGTSTVTTSRRYGLPFNANQVRHSVDVAFARAGRIVTENPSFVPGVAFPDTDDYRKAVKRLGRGFELLGCVVFFVSPSGVDVEHQLPLRADGTGLSGTNHE